MTSVSEIAVQTYFCPVQQVCLARQLRLVWFYFDPLGTFAPLAGLHRLPDLLPDNYQFAQPLRFASSLGPAAKFRNFPPLVSFDWHISSAHLFRSV